MNAQDFGMSTATIVEEDATIFVGDIEVKVDIWATTSGSQFIKQKSTKTGKDYPTWIGQKVEPTEYVMYKGFNHEVRLSKSGKRFILARSSKGSIYCKYGI
jgi:hypothetical protein